MVQNLSRKTTSILDLRQTPRSPVVTMESGDSPLSLHDATVRQAIAKASPDSWNRWLYDILLYLSDES